MVLVNEHHSDIKTLLYEVTGLWVQHKDATYWYLLQHQEIRNYNLKDVINIKHKGHNDRKDLIETKS